MSARAQPAERLRPVSHYAVLAPERRPERATFPPAAPGTRRERNPATGRRA